MTQPPLLIEGGFLMKIEPILQTNTLQTRPKGTIFQQARSIAVQAF